VPQVGGIEAKLWSAFENRKPAIDEVLGSEGLYTDELKAACLLAYRLQEPEISLFEGVASLLVRLRTGGIKTGIITDGRPEGQKAKIRALGLEQLIDEIIITDEIGGAQFRKPNDIAFRIMQGRLGISFSEMVYVGDNPAKDFAAPEMLGMQSIFFDNKDGLYSNLSAAPPGIRTITAIAELAGELLGCRQDR